MNRFFTIIILVFISAAATAQKTLDYPFSKEERELDLKNALNFGAYFKALPAYTYLYELDSHNIIFAHRLALCYLYTYENQKAALPLLERIIKAANANKEAWYDLAYAYQLHYRFNEAIDMYQEYLKHMEDKDDKNIIPASRQIEMCKNAQELVKNKINVSFSNLGDDINSEYPDYQPYVDAEENLLVFTSKRRGNTGNKPDLDGYYTPDVYHTRFDGRSWKKARRMSTMVNSKLFDESVGLSADGNTLLLFYYNDIAIEDIYISEKKGRSFYKASSIGEKINQKSSVESSACLSPKEDYLIYSSNKDGGFGGYDLYISFRDMAGNWNVGKNLGPSVNSEWDEINPVLSPDEAFLYFASTGHNSMGKFDLFKSAWDTANKVANIAENMGYPVNDVHNNLSISFTKNPAFAYLAAFRMDTHGCTDIYRVRFKEFPAKTYTITGNILLENGSNAIAKIHSLKESLQVSLDSLTYMHKHSVFRNLADTASIQKKRQEMIKSLKKKLEQSEHACFTIDVHASDTEKKLFSMQVEANSATYEIQLSPGRYILKIQLPVLGSFLHEFEIYDYLQINNQIKKDIILKTPLK